MNGDLREQLDPTLHSLPFSIEALQVSQPPREQSKDLLGAVSSALAAICTVPVGLPACWEAKEQV